MGLQRPLAPLVLIVGAHATTRARRVDLLQRTLAVRTANAETGDDALCIAAAWRPAVIVLDLLNLTLPGTSAEWEVARHLKGSPNVCDANLIVIGHYNSVRDRRTATELGCERLLVKPSEWALREAVRACLDKRGLVVDSPKSGPKKVREASRQQRQCPPQAAEARRRR
jgi:CheY-like chemotaxis protein